eukprot:TRINITY_DN7605_c0_g1_i1.p1 TRINITY_DN7605_c0_g1~~TRINITY_DN7605_c0_g1_i1.p1  ORF type:complete len:287 (-),score=72.67 TRINITY_DN7605_c0_g1_i1:20-880(-)
MNKVSLFVLFLFGTCFAYPVPIPAGGRLAVHGWLILPMEQEIDSPLQPIEAWFVHHTPEFWATSPHDFQIILQGSLTAISTADNVTFPIGLPIPPLNESLVDEFTFTPPPPFSLNDLLSGEIQEMVGVVYNGSFDTSYERIAIAIANLQIRNLTTAVYLNITLDDNYDTLRYLSYPRSPIIWESGLIDFYFSHEIHSQPDFDHVVHTQIDFDSCVGHNIDYEVMQQPAAVWEIIGVKNELKDRLAVNDVVSVELITNGASTLCKMVVLEELHCVVGPGFFSVCPPL